MCFPAATDSPGVSSWVPIAPPGHPRRRTHQPRRADLHHGYELVRARGGYITEEAGCEHAGKTETDRGTSRERTTPKVHRGRQLGHS